MKTPRWNNTPEQINELLPGEVIVIGTNTQGIHGAGAALQAKNKWGLKQGVPMGLCGQSYGLITKSLIFPREEKEAMIYFIGVQFFLLFAFAQLRKDLTFYLTKVGTGLAEFTVEEIKEILEKTLTLKPTNVILPIEWEQEK